MKMQNENEKPILNDDNSLVQERAKINKKFDKYNSTIEELSKEKSDVLDNILDVKSAIREKRIKINATKKQLFKSKLKIYRNKFSNIRISLAEGKLNLCYHNTNKRDKEINPNKFIVSKDKKYEENSKLILNESLYSDLEKIIKELYESNYDDSKGIITSMKILKMSLEKLDQELDSNIITLKDYKKRKNGIILKMLKEFLTHLSDCKDSMLNNAELKKNVKKEAKNK